MNTQLVFDTIRATIARELELDLASLRDDVSLRREYGLDSVAAVNIIFHLEDALQVDIDVAMLARVDSINELKAVVAKILSSA